MKNVDNVIREFHVALRRLYGNKLKNVILYGSWARHEATQDSDVDLLVVLGGDVQPGKEIDRMIETITDINLKYNVLLSVYPVCERDYENLKSPLLMNVRKEGVPA